MDSIAAASVQRSTIQLQQAVQLDMVQKATSSEQDMAARLLASAQVVPAAPETALTCGTTRSTRRH